MVLRQLQRVGAQWHPARLHVDTPTAARLAARLDMPAVQARRCAGCEAVSVWGGGQLKRVIDNYLAYPLGRAMMELDAWLLHCRYAWWCEAFGTLMALMRWTKKDLARNEP
jgi:hypothetical protein